MARPARCLAHTNLPSIPEATLPDRYVAAQSALAECERIDECKDWADKAAAMASYAKQADDKTLEDLSTRIKARAIRRCGQLLKQIEPATGRHLKSGSAPALLPAQKEKIARVRDLLTEGKITRSDANARIAKIDPDWAKRTRRGAAAVAGLSDDQRDNAIRVANVPDAEFEAAVERENPATITELAELGTRKRKGREALTKEKPPGFLQASYAIGHIERLAEFCRANDPALIAGGIDSSELEPVMSNVRTIQMWLTALLRAKEN